uniref:Putative group ii salivary lipocalin n=1 Tax=Rhipicephalus pulchellus TaxID=72859 RepID=L7M8M0_RHIPC
MSFLRLVLCILFASSSILAEEKAEKDPGAYAENSKYFDKQHISEMTNLDSTLYVMKRDYNTTTGFRCLSATKVGQHTDGSYVYTLNARSSGESRYYDVTMTAERTGCHSDANSAFYEEFPGEGATHHKLMTMDEQRTCFLFATEHRYGGYGCLLVVSEEIADQEISEECLTVYNQQCEKGVEPYERSCKDNTSSTPNECKKHPEKKQPQVLDHLSCRREL